MEKILFLHGALGSKFQFNAISQQLQNEYECHSLNFAGHGGELIPPQGLTFSVFAENILSYLDKHNISRIHLFGFSMGGYAALYFAHLHPHRVNKVMTVNVKFNWDPISAAKEAGLLDPDKMMEKVPAFANNLMMLHGMNLWKSLLQSTSQMMKQLSETVLLNEEQLAALPHPVLLGIGDRDKTSSITETLNVYKAMNNAALWVIPNTAHPFEKIELTLLLPALRNFFH